VQLADTGKTASTLSHVMEDLSDPVGVFMERSSSDGAGGSMNLKRESREKTATSVLTAATALVLLSTVSPSDAAPKSGRAAFDNHCRTCHSARAGDNRLGPSLYGIVGAKAGSVPGYSNYSQGLRSSSIVWDEMTLDRFITNPESLVPNNNMKPFNGVTDAAERASIIRFLRENAG
jgi:cytochrome c